MVKNLPAMQETWVQSLDWEDSLEEGMATHSSVLAWRSPWTEPGGLRLLSRESAPTYQRDHSLSASLSESVIRLISTFQQLDRHLSAA